MLYISDGTGWVVDSDASQVIAGAVVAGAVRATVVVANVANIGETVLIDSTGERITNGKLTVTNPGSVVIIDGTSDMFRIAASGTTSVAFPGAPATASASVSLTGLGSAYTVAPACSFMVCSSSGSYLNARIAGVYVAPSGAGAVTFQTYGMVALSAATGYPIVSVVAQSCTVNPGTTALLYYAVFAQVSI